MGKPSKKAFVVAVFAAVGLLQASASYAGSGGHHPYDRGRESHGHGHDKGHDKHHDKGHDKHHDKGHDRHHDKGHGGHGWHRDYGHRDYHHRDYGHRHGPGCGHGHYSHGPRVYYGGHHHYPRYAPPAYHYPPPYYRSYTYHPAGYYCGHCRYHAATVDVFHHHIVHEHRHLVWEDVLAGLSWHAQPRLYVFGEFDL